AGQPAGAAFFSKVTLRRYAKDAVIDVLKGAADVTCVDQGTVGALCRFYGIDSRVRTVAVSPRYNVDVLYTSLNNLATHRTEVEQRAHILAPVAHAVRVTVLLIRISGTGAVVAGVADAIAVTVGQIRVEYIGTVIASIADAVAIAIALGRVGHAGTVITGVTD